MQGHFFSQFEQYILDSILELGLSFGQATSGSLLFRGESGLVLVAGKNLQPSHFGVKDRGARTISEMVFERGEPLLIDDADNLSSLILRRRAERYSLSFPIRNEVGKVVGVLNLNRAEKPFQQEEVSVIEKLSLAIALLVEENLLRRNRERLLIVFSEIVNLFGGRNYLQEENIFEKVFSSTRLLLGIDQGVVFKLSSKRPYMVFTHHWPKKLSFSQLNLGKENSCGEQKIAVVKRSLSGREKLLLTLPMQSIFRSRFLFVTVVNQEPDLLNSLLLSMIARLGETSLDSFFLLRKSERLVQERERNRLARELHDGLAQILTSLRLYVHFLKNTPFAENKGQTQEVIQKLDQLARMGIEESRFILSELKGKPVSSSRLEREVKSVIHAFSHPRIMIHENIRITNRLISFRVFRVITSLLREALSNVMKHSQGKNVWIELYDDSKNLHLLVRDDGVGFDEHASLEEEEGTHFGLYSMRNRVRLVRGRFVLRSSPGKGVTVKVEIPLR